MALPSTASPPTNAIGIDPGVTYYYVIAQTGATSFTVDAVTGFTLSVSSQGVLTISFTGAAPTLSTPYNVTVHLTNASGTVAQTIPFIVSGASTVPRYYPSITSAAYAAAGINAPFSYTITTDVSVDMAVAPFAKGSRFAQGLPAGLTYNSATGVITGTAPYTNGTYAILLGARIAFTGAPTSFRYLILVVGAGSDLIVNTDTGTGTGGTFSPTAPTSFTFTSAFSPASLMAGPIYERPFHADPNHYVYHVQYKVRLDAFTSLAWDQPGPYGGIHTGESQWKNERGGILTFWRTFAIVPPPRDEYESFHYAFKWWHTEGGSASIAEIPKMVNSRVHYDYWHVTGASNSIGGWTRDPITGAFSGGADAATTAAAIPLPHAPNIILLFNQLYSQNGYGSLVPGQEILAEDATMRCWMGNIYERKQRFVVEESTGEQLFS